jgi:hypothetical protein
MSGADDARASEKVSRWMDPVNVWQPHAAIRPGPPVGSAAVMQKAPAGDARVPAAWERGRVAIMVETGVYGDISASVSTYANDLADVGFSSVVVTISGNAEYLRDTLITLYNEPDSLVGTVLIGELPYVIFEMMQDFGWGPEYEDFPCDLYFMDMDGIWEDIADDGEVQPDNGKLDTWLGETSVEIWASRLRTANLAELGSETDLLNNFFTRNHTLRWDLLNNLHTGLVYDDDDWAGEGPEDAACLEAFFGMGNVTMIVDPEATTASDYINQRLTAAYQLDLIRSHGSPGGHGFYENNMQDFQWVSKDEYPLHDPAAVFFSFFVCSGCDFASSGYLGGTAVFNPEGSALLAWGSTKTGGMTDDHFMYDRMAIGECVGEGFKDWFNQMKDLPYAPRWYYGMVLIGDGSITEYPVDCNNNFIADDSEIPVSCGGSCTVDCDPDCNCNGIPDACEVPDCNDNTVPDECEIPVSCGGLCTADCDPECNCNGIPDACEVDCNSNGVPDDCDIEGSTSEDCQPNGIPDECDIVGGGGVLVNEDFEDGLVPPGWTATGTFQITDQCGAEHAYCGGSYWAYAGDTVTCSYGNNELGDLTAPPVLLGYGGSELRFCSRLESEEDWDFGRVLVNGTVAWEESGGSAEWEEHLVDLGAFAGQTVTVTFQFESDSGISGTLGWQVDNVNLFSESLDSNGNGIPDDCEIRRPEPWEYAEYGGWCDQDSDCWGPSETVAYCVPAPGGDYPGVCYAPANRYISIARHPEQAENTARRITLQGGAGQWWVGSPTHNAVENMYFAGASSTSVYAGVDAGEWLDGDWPDVVHVKGCEIAPGYTYEVQAIQFGSDEADEGSYSEVLELRTASVWGDIVSTCYFDHCLPPTGAVTEPSIDDVLAVVNAFTGVRNAPLPWMDVDPVYADGEPEGLWALIGDVLAIVNAFSGQSYPGNGPLGCTP